MDPAAAATLAGTVYSAAKQTALETWGWSEAQAEDLARNAQALFDEEEKLKGRPLREFWDVNPSSVLEAHLARLPKGEKRTRFPPEPNGYAHFGHAKSMHMNFHESFERMKPEPEIRHVTFRLDDTNPEVESQEFVDKLAEAVQWLGWMPRRTSYTSDYFPEMYEFALRLIRNGDAYVCFQSGAEIEQSRKLCREYHAGNLDVKPESPYRNTSPEINLARFLDMKRGMYAESECSLRLKMDMFHANPNMWDPVAYRIIYHHHPRSGNEWCIYPTYDYSHCIVDSLEDIDYSICTLEFETRRESYYWLLWKLELYRPKVFEFARLDMTNMVMSKRKLKKLVETKQVRGWDDCRMPTLMGMRRRGFVPDEINQFMREIGITRNQSVVDVNKFFQVVSSKLELESARCFGVLDPVLLELTNLPSEFSQALIAKKFPQMADNAELRDGMWLTRECWVERDNIVVDGNEDVFGFAEGRVVRLRYGPLVVCRKVEFDSQTGRAVRIVGEAVFPEGDALAGLNPTDVQALPASKGVLHWLSKQSALECEVRLYDHLLVRDEDEEMNPRSEIVLTTSVVEKDFVLQAWEQRASAPRFQLERVGFFCFDGVDSVDGGKLSRKAERMVQEAAKAERLKYSAEEFFLRPGVKELYSAFDPTGFPTAGADGTPLSKSQTKTLKKDLDKHKKELDEEAKRKAKQ
ncbi:glutamine-tRNA ligase [Batrachochytrium salamandrivorans]|nr:glutamine-tRNA ligase [Batrachochytrium salamandrivorans]